MTIRKTTLQQSTSCKSISRATCVELRSTKPSKIENFDNLITALVDPTEQRFTIHQEPACAKSKVFKATCSKRRLEGREKVLRLPELKAGTFKVYCSWVYSDDIPRPVCTGSSSEDDRSAEKELLVDLYLTGAILNDLHLRNRSLHALFDSMRNQNKLLNVTQLTLVWQSTSSGSLFRGRYLLTCIWRASQGLISPRKSPNIRQNSCKRLLWLVCRLCRTRCGT
jgi:hypothetical protein